MDLIFFGIFRSKNVHAYFIRIHFRVQGSFNNYVTYRLGGGGGVSIFRYLHCFLLLYSIVWRYARGGGSKWLFFALHSYQMTLYYKNTETQI